MAQTHPTRQAKQTAWNIPLKTTAIRGFTADCPPFDTRCLAQAVLTQAIAQRGARQAEPARCSAEVALRVDPRLLDDAALEHAQRLARPERIDRVRLRRRLACAFGQGAPQTLIELRRDDGLLEHVRRA